MTDRKVSEDMSDYERRVWESSLTRLYSPLRNVVFPRRVREFTAKTAERASGFAEAHLPTAQVKKVVEEATSGALELTFKPAFRSSSIEKTLRGYSKVNDKVTSIGDIKQLDVEEIDRFRRRKGFYVAASAMQGSATSLVVTGSVVSTSVKNGTHPTLIVAAVAGDTVASLASMGRIVGSVAVRYGYDVRLPDEELFAMGVLSLGMATSLESKHAALSALSKLTQQMMRNATWQQLNKHVLVRAINRAYASISIQLTHARLAQVVPVVGVGINATLSANMAGRIYSRAEDVYRVRFLSEKYGLDPKTWLQDQVPENDIRTSGSDLPNVAEILAEELNHDR